MRVLPPTGGLERIGGHRHDNSRGRMGGVAPSGWRYTEGGERVVVPEGGTAARCKVDGEPALQRRSLLDDRSTHLYIRPVASARCTPRYSLQPPPDYSGLPARTAPFGTSNGRGSSRTGSTSAGWPTCGATARCTPGGRNASSPSTDTARRACPPRRRRSRSDTEARHCRQPPGWACRFRRPRSRRQRPHRRSPRWRQPRPHPCLRQCSHSDSRPLWHRRRRRGALRPSAPVARSG